MSVIGMMQPSASGMSAQSNRLSTVADNVANAETVGYKRADAQFASLLFPENQLYYTGVVLTNTRHLIDIQGPLSFAADTTDLAVQGKGFFVVTDPSAPSTTQSFLTRAGAFVENGDGNLINAAGYQLMGYDLTAGPAPSGVTSPSGLVPVNLLAIQTLDPTASTEGSLMVNLDSTTVIPAPPSTTSTTAFDSNGNQVTLDVQMTRLTSQVPYTWQATVFDHASPATPLVTSNLTFDNRGQYASGSPISIPVPGGSTVSLDMSESTQLAASFVVMGKTMNGSASSTLDHIEITTDGTVQAIYANDVVVPSYQIPLANVISENNLTAMAGNVFQANNDTGAVQVWQANSDGNGIIKSGMLESSTVDVATELTDMIGAQRAFEASSKAFQVGAEVTGTLISDINF
jgi:flagellar hook protein FlgE